VTTESASFPLNSLIGPVYQKCSGHTALLVVLVTAVTEASHSFPQFLQLIISYRPDLWVCAWGFSLIHRKVIVRIFMHCDVHLSLTCCNAYIGVSSNTQDAHFRVSITYVLLSFFSYVWKLWFTCWWGSECKRKVISLLEKVEVLCRLDNGMNIAVVGCGHGAK